MSSITKEILHDFVALFYPNYCMACEDTLVKGESIICTRCMLEMPKTNYHRDHENPFFKKLQGRVSLSYVMALFKFVKESRVQKLLHALKYKNQPEIGVALGNLYGMELMRAGYSDKFDLIIPVPLHKSRFRKRGYNQSAEFGKGISSALEIPCSDELIIRITSTETQTKKTRLARWENVSTVFSVVKPEQLAGKRILLVDDVITTGATVEACAQQLIPHCVSVSIACIAAA